MDTDNTSFKNSDVEIDLVQLLQYFRKKVKLIISSMVVFMIIAALGTIFLIEKKYESTARIYFKPEVVEGTLKYDEVNAYNAVINNYVMILRGNTISSDVAKSLDLPQDAVSNSLTIEKEEDTQIISITANTANSKLSKRIVDQVIKSFKLYAKDTLKINNISVIDQAKINRNQVSPSVKINTVVGALIGMFISLAYIFIKFVGDTKIHDIDDAERVLKIHMLGSIPRMK